MGRLIDDPLAFSRTSRIAMTIRPVDMDRLARAVVEDQADTAAEREVAVAVGRLPPAMGDELLRRDVLENLLSSAIRFRGGRAGASVEPGSRETADGAEYFVKDNTVGFEPEDGHRLFGVFQRLHGPDEFEGTGISMALVERVVERLGGRVRAEGTPGRGATFAFAVGTRSRPAGAEPPADA